MKISYIFPTRSRPNKFFDCLANIGNLSESKDYEIICAFDEDDSIMNNDEVRSKIKHYENVKYFYGLSANKIAACNREAHKISPDTSIICLFSDDMRFEVYGFDSEIRAAFQKHFPEFDGVIHFPDSHALSKTMTLTIMGRGLYNKLGYLYWPEYISVFADNDLTDMAKKMNKYVFINKKIFDHYHPIWGMAEWDEQYRRTESKELYQKDKATFLKRKANNFGI